MAYRIAALMSIKKMLAVVVADVAVEGEFQFLRHTVGTSPTQLRSLAEWLLEQQVDEVVMESTAQYWRPVWEALERYLATATADAGGRWPDGRGPCTWRRPSRIVGPGGGRRISRMPNA